MDGICTGTNDAFAQSTSARHPSSVPGEDFLTVSSQECVAHPYSSLIWRDLNSFDAVAQTGRTMEIRLDRLETEATGLVSMPWEV
jgi:hypothetical protein